MGDRGSGAALALALALGVVSVRAGAEIGAMAGGLREFAAPRMSDPPETDSD